MELNLFSLEICADSHESARHAVQGGANRIELCSGLNVGGVTPSLGLFRVIHRDFPTLPICVLIRPRAGDFFYDAAEFEAMRADIELFKQEGAAAFCIGILKQDGSIDVDRCAELSKLAEPLDCVFSRAFDLCVSPREALATISRDLPGINRILTSGSEQTALAGASNLRELVADCNQLNTKRSSKKLSILVGGGVSDSNLEELVRRTGAHEYHASASKIVESAAQFKSGDVQSKDKSLFCTSVLSNNPDWLSRRVSQVSTIRSMRSILDRIASESN